MTDWVFPLRYCPLVPTGDHPGAFGTRRKFDVHTGVDLYGRHGQEVYAIRSGSVVEVALFTGAKVGSPWWKETWAVTVEDEEGYYVYGEISTILEKGQKIITGSVIGEIAQVLQTHKLNPTIPGHSVSMLHMERYSKKYQLTAEFADWKLDQDKPGFLLNPSEVLVQLHKKYNVKSFSSSPS